MNHLELRGLMDEINRKLRVLSTKGTRKQKAETVENMQECIDYLRLEVCYLTFDLEATYRERNSAITELHRIQSGEDGS